MKKNILLASIIIFLFSCENVNSYFLDSEFLGLGESQFNPAIYDGIPLEMYETVFVDDFNDNSNEWFTGNYYGELYGEINNGYYYLKNFTSGKIYFSDKFIEIDESKNFEIEVSLKTYSNDTREGNGLLWGYKDDSYGIFSFYYFLISGTGEYTFGDCNVNEYNNFNDWKSDYLLPSNFNKITVRKYQNRYFFFINEKFIKSSNFKQFYGQSIAFKIIYKSEIYIDYLKIRYFDE